MLHGRRGAGAELRLGDVELALKHGGNEARARSGEGEEEKEARQTT